ncbi:MAG: sulfotransferase domain-containing protein [Candidatus Marinimicrobia bacterium]|nr:sulfotransferase domain-containing protein [Candidatus Neomarinimicrobiota bacterium]
MRLPDFIGIGAPRCGTTWLSHILNQHSQIYFNPNYKEIHYFDHNYHRGLKWYARFFSSVAQNIRCGEFTPNYMVQTDSFSRIHQMNPKVKLIIVLRDPVKRAFSHYMQKKRYKRSMKDFETTVQSNEFQILDYGNYGEQLSQLLSIFPQEQVHTIIFEEMIADSQKTFTELQKFLEVEKIDLDPNQAPKNQMNTSRFLWLKILTRGLRGLARKYYWFRILFYGVLPGRRIIQMLRTINAKAITIKKEQMSPEIEQWLVDHYAADKAILEQIIGRPLSLWSL